ncbi:MAG: cupin domain-containing protein [Acidimicrobiia bacterium]
MDDEATRRQFLEFAALAATAVVVGGGIAGPAGATPPSGDVSRTPLAQGRLEDQITVATHGPSDFHIQLVTVAPGADSGWHTHPGMALDIVKSGTVTAYIDNDGCEPVTATAGQAVMIPAGVVHLARNEGTEPAEIYVTYLVAAGAPPRTDAEPPANCPT